MGKLWILGGNIRRKHYLFTKSKTQNLPRLVEICWRGGADGPPSLIFRVGCSHTGPRGQLLSHSVLVQLRQAGPVRGDETEWSRAYRESSPGLQSPGFWLCLDQLLFRVLNSVNFVLVHLGPCLAAFASIWWMLSLVQSMRNSPLLDAWHLLNPDQEDTCLTRT